MVHEKQEDNQDRRPESIAECHPDLQVNTEKFFNIFNRARVLAREGCDRRAEYDEDRQRNEGNKGQKHEPDRDQAVLPPRPIIPHEVRAFQPRSQGFKTVGRNPDRSDGREAEDIARAVPHHFFKHRTNGAGDVIRQVVEQKVHHRLDALRSNRQTAQRGCEDQKRKERQ